MPGVDPSVTFSDFPPELQALVDQANQRRQLALSLQKQFLTPTMPTNPGPVASRMNPLQPLLQALGSYMSGKNAASATGEIADVGKQYQGMVDTERQGLSGQPAEQQIAALLGSKLAANRQYGTSLQGQWKTEQEVKHLQNQDVVAQAELDVKRGQLSEETRSHLAEEGYRTAYLSHLNDQIAEQVRQHNLENAARLKEIANQAAQVGVAQQMLRVHRVQVGMSPEGTMPDLGPRMADIVKGERPAPGTTPQGRMGATPVANAQLDQVMQYAKDNGIDFDPQMYWNRVAAEKQFLPTGPAGIQLRSFTNLEQHIPMLDALAANMNNTNSPQFNAAKIAYEKATGQPAPTNMQTLGEVVLAEMDKARAVHGGGEHERERINEALKSSNPYPVLHGALNTYLGLMGVQKNNLVAQGRQAGVHERYLTIPQGEHPDMNSMPSAMGPTLEDLKAERKRRGQ